MFLSLCAHQCNKNNSIEKGASCHYISLLVWCRPKIIRAIFALRRVNNAGALQKPLCLSLIMPLIKHNEGLEAGSGRAEVRAFCVTHVYGHLKSSALQTEIMAEALGLRRALMRGRLCRKDTFITTLCSIWRGCSFQTTSLFPFLCCFHSLIMSIYTTADPPTS